MFDTTPSIATAGPLVIVVMVVIAGCTSGTTLSAESSAPKNQVDPPDTSDETLDTTNTDSANPSEQLQHPSDIAPGSAGLSPEEQQRVRRTIANFYEDLPKNESERRETGFQAAHEICKEDRNFKSHVEVADLEKGSDTATLAARRMRFSAEIVQENFNDDVPLKHFDQLEGGVNKATRYAPLIGSYNRLAALSCAADEKRTDRSLERFYVATMVFGVDVVLVSTGAFYKPAFAGTRFMTNSASRVGLYRLRYLCGNRCWALGMSEIHWGLRKSMLGVVSYTVQRSGEVGLDLTEDEIDWVALARDQDVDTAVILKQLNSTGKECGSAILSASKGASAADRDEVGGILNSIKEKGESLDSVDDARDAIPDECQGEP